MRDYLPFLREVLMQMKIPSNILRNWGAMSTSVLRTSVDIAPQFLRMLEGIFPYLPQKREVISHCHTSKIFRGTDVFETFYTTTKKVLLTEIYRLNFKYHKGCLGSIIINNFRYFIVFLFFFLIRQILPFIIIFSLLFNLLFSLLFSLYSFFIVIILNWNILQENWIYYKVFTNLARMV